MPPGSVRLQKNVQKRNHKRTPGMYKTPQTDD